MVASGPDAQIVNYSDRFTLIAITGHNTVDFMGADGAHEDLRKRQVAGAYTIPYQLQTGPTRYAPMAKKPGSTIPAKSSPTPQHPTSAYSVATAYLPLPTIQATMSATRTYSVASVENTVCEAIVFCLSSKKYLAVERLTRFGAHYRHRRRLILMTLR